jgi:rSAM/selenodomain-associated transferase 2
VRISVIIPTLNEQSTIVGTIERTQEAGADEIIVVDGGSRDETARLAYDAGCVVLECEPGRAVQQNRGADHASGDVLLFLHADTWPDPTALQQIGQALHDSSVSGGAFRQRIEARGMAYRWLESGNAWRVTWRGLPFGDQGLFLRAETFHQLGRFPEVPLMEDLILAKRLRKITRIRLLPGPLHVSARRWQKYGVIQQTLRNWTLQTAFACGVSPRRLARFYPRMNDSE